MNLDAPTSLSPTRHFKSKQTYHLSILISMTLKRKASYTTIISPRSVSSSYNASVAPVPFMTGDVVTIDETPRHMHSRTRKRFKNDRPDEQTVYSELRRLPPSRSTSQTKLTISQTKPCNSSTPRKSNGNTAMPRYLSPQSTQTKTSR